MFIGHLPTGYIISRLWLNNIDTHTKSYKGFLNAGMLGSLFPDVDMFYFYLVDNRQHHHHKYFTHYPILWLTILLCSLLWKYSKYDSRLALLSVVFSFNALIHMFLDTIVGDIWWFAPFMDKPYALFKVPTLYHPWWLNFILHWSFALELFFVIYAVILWVNNRKKHLLT